MWLCGCVRVDGWGRHQALGPDVSVGAGGRPGCRHPSSWQERSGRQAPCGPPGPHGAPSHCPPPRPPRLGHCAPGPSQSLLRVNGPADPARRLPNTLSLSIGGLVASAALQRLSSQLAASAGAACHSDDAAAGRPAAVSSVLAAMKASNEPCACASRVLRVPDPIMYSCPAAQAGTFWLKTPVLACGQPAAQRTRADACT